MDFEKLADTGKLSPEKRAELAGNEYLIVPTWFDALNEYERDFGLWGLVESVFARLLCYSEVPMKGRAEREAVVDEVCRRWLARDKRKGRANPIAGARD